MGLAFETIPLGSFLHAPATDRDRYIDAACATPSMVFDLLSADQTAAFIRGLTKTYNLDPKSGITIAQFVLRLGIGEITFAQLSGLLSQTLSLPITQTQKMSQEIERDLFAPVMLELNRFVTQKRLAPTPKFGASKPATPPLTRPVATQQGIRNVVDLKQQTSRPPLAPPIPHPAPRPVASQPSLPPQRAIPTTPISPSTSPKPLPTPTRPQPPRSVTSKSPLSFDPKTLQRKSQLWEDKK